jgi:hypothetical protein
VNLAAPFCLETMLSDRNIELEPMPGRTGSRTFVRDVQRPVMIFETFHTVQTNVMPQHRFGDVPTQELTFDPSERV